MELFDIVTKYCDIRLLKTFCNFRGCEKKPTKEMLIVQIDMNTAKRREIISIYLCQDHYNSMEKALEGVVGKFKNGKIYKIKQNEIKSLFFK